MKRDKQRIIIDTNLWVSFLITSNYSKLDKVVASAQVTVLFSEELLNEFLEVTARPKLRKYFSPDSVEELMDWAEDFAEIVKVKSRVTVCRDFKDNFLLSLAKDGKADFLITGDKDLLVLKKFGRTKILKMEDYLSL